MVAKTESNLCAHPVGIVGTGTMGREIAARNVQHGVPVRLYDTRPPDKHSLVQLIAAEAGDSPANVMPQISLCTSIEDLRGCRLVLECITERVEAKRRLFQQLRKAMGQSVLLASNTSSITLAELTHGMIDARLIVLHFCHPVCKRRLVEVVTPPQAAAQTRGEVDAYCRQLQQMPFTAPDAPGFVVNRLLQRYFGTALRLAECGCGIEAIDAAARWFGMDLGPFQYLDEIGFDVAVRSGSRVSAAFPGRLPESTVLTRLMERKCLGVKTRTGFYSYSEAGQRLGLSQQAQSLGLAAGSPDVDEPFALDVSGKLMVAMLVEARALISEGRVQAPADIDIVSCHGLGFPQERHGLLSWAREAGIFDAAPERDHAADHAAAH